MNDKNKDTKSFTEMSKDLLNDYAFWQYCQEPYLEPNQKSMVKSMALAKIINDF